MQNISTTPTNLYFGKTAGNTYPISKNVIHQLLNAFYDQTENGITHGEAQDTFNQHLVEAIQPRGEELSLRNGDFEIEPSGNSEYYLVHTGEKRQKFLARTSGTLERFIKRVMGKLAPLLPTFSV